jgi:hypothetical protein
MERPKMTNLNFFRSSIASLSSLLLCSASFAVSQTPNESASPQPLRFSTQIVVVITPDWSTVQGRLQRYERAHSGDPWTPVGNSIAIVVGKKGMGWGAGIRDADDSELRTPQDPVKKEGDGKSPAGVFTISTAFGYAAQPPSDWKLPYTSLTPSVECVDDSASRFYNRILDRASVTPEWNSSERMSQAGEAYRWGAVIDHNPTAIPYTGSCVFLHVWAGPAAGTAGCTAMPREQLEPILAWFDPAKNPLLVQLPVAQYTKLKERWQLP